MSRIAWLRLAFLGAVVLAPTASALCAQPAELPAVQKVRNYLPHMTVPEVRDLLTRSDVVIIPVASLEQHGLHLPIGTDYLNGVERAKLIAQRTDVLVAPILLPGQSPYHMGFEGTVSLPSTLIQEVYVEAAKSLMRHGFKRFLILNAHGGNAAITRFIVDRINQETEGIAVDLGSVLGPFRARTTAAAEPDPAPAVFDRHGGTGETSSSMYLIPQLVDLDAARPAELTLPRTWWRCCPMSSQATRPLSPSSSPRDSRTKRRARAPRRPRCRRRAYGACATLASRRPSAAVRTRRAW
jgi:creatinine amidohydrolase